MSEAGLISPDTIKGDLTLHDLLDEGIDDLGDPGLHHAVNKARALKLT